MHVTSRYATLGEDKTIAGALGSVAELLISANPYDTLAFLFLQGKAQINQNLIKS
jgi:hypothetical protein